MDDATTISDLKELVASFVSERDWAQFHNAKNLSMSIAIEAAELMEHFQWVQPDEVASFNQAKRLGVREELADVVSYCLAFANAMDIDLSSAVRQKMARNAEKYPAEKFQGRYGHDDPNYQQDKAQ